MLEIISDRKFRNETVELDGKKFLRCTFRQCVLTYLGGEAEIGPGCIVKSSRPMFFGSSSRSILLLDELGLLKFHPAKKAAALRED